MKIQSATSRICAIPLSRPYTIAFRTVTAVELVLIELVSDRGHRGLGVASPEPHVTGETNLACQSALADLSFLHDEDPRQRNRLTRRVAQSMPRTPAAAAAVDMALHDLFAQVIGLPLCKVLGQVHTSLPTSITIGIKPLAETLAEADEYIGRGFAYLKVKTGKNLGEDIERLAKLRERFGDRVHIRADANQGYTLEQTRDYFAATELLGIEFLEQPIAAAATETLGSLPLSMRQKIAVDEPLQTPSDALRLSRDPQPGGIFNIKLMKSGGISPALRIAEIADLAGISLMWGCMDESAISIAAALHAALACPATRYLDLDGSFDLARDIATGGFVLESGGVMRPAEGPGLGVVLG